MCRAVNRMELNLGHNAFDEFPAYPPPSPLGLHGVTMDAIKSK